MLIRGAGRWARLRFLAHVGICAGSIDGDSVPPAREVSLTDQGKA